MTPSHDAGALNPLYRLTLFVAGNEPNSRTARENLTSLCEKEFAGSYEIEVIDVLQNFPAAVTHNILVIPTLLIRRRRSTMTVLGNLSNREKVRAALYAGEQD